MKLIAELVAVDRQKMAKMLVQSLGVKVLSANWILQSP